MTKFRPITDINAAEWLEAMKLSKAEVPDVVIVEGSWWRAQRTEWRLSYLTDLREFIWRSSGGQKLAGLDRESPGASCQTWNQRSLWSTHYLVIDFHRKADMMDVWHRAGYLSVDMETATTLAVAQHFNMPALSLLVVWDDLTRGKRFLDPLTNEEQAALDLGNQAVYEVALRLADRL